MNNKSRQERTKYKTTITTKEENNMNKLLSKKLTTTNESNLKTNLAAACYLTAISTIMFVEPAYADWFKTGDITTNLVTPIYTLVHDNMGKAALATGGLTLIFTRGMDLWQKGTVFAGGAMLVGGAIKLADHMLV